jgi:triacylglycerol lipase
VYWDDDPAKAIWERAGRELELDLELEVLSIEGVQCHIVSSRAFVIVAFRGTQPDDWQDLIAISRGDRVPWEFGAVHRGFLCAHNRIWPVLKTKLDEIRKTHSVSVWFTGHSLGAALATLSMDRFDGVSCLYTIGSPPVGDREFAREFDRRHAGRCFRYVNHHDIVVYLPRLLTIFLGRYKHVKERKYINARGEISRTGPSIVDALVVLWSWRRALLGALIDHTPRNYAAYIRHDWPRHVNRAGPVAKV